MSKALDLIVGGEPRVDLLPPEVRLARRGAGVRNALVVVLIAAVLAVAGGYGFGALQANAARDRLATEEARTTALLTQQQEYIAVRRASSAIAEAEAATRVGTSTAIDWKAFISKLSAAMPAGSYIAGFSMDSATPVSALQQSAALLSVPRIATVLINAKSRTLPEASTWLGALGKVAGVADVTLTSIQSGDAAYDVTVTVGVSSAVLEHPITVTKVSR